MTPFFVLVCVPPWRQPRPLFFSASSSPSLASFSRSPPSPHAARPYPPPRNLAVRGPHPAPRHQLLLIRLLRREVGVVVAEGFVPGPVSLEVCALVRMGRVVWSRLGRASDLRR